nr:uncharacterized protein LOC111416738 [Onthophagus taurus]
MLFTCAVVRAVHLELVPDLITECCIRGLRRFIARRGVPDVVYSDNAKTFKRTDLELRKLSAILESEKIQDLVRKHRIHWRFIAERAPWWGGFWERMVKTVKDALKITLGRAYVERDELETILIEIEATINSRPLTYISDDSTDLTKLSPSHFLTEVRFCMNLTSKEISRSEILKRWRDREKTLKRFWDRWRSDYLQQLRTAHLRKSINAISLNIGDIVLVQENSPRLQWKMGRIVNLYQGRDGKIRACEVKLSGGTTLRRPVQLLYLLEVQAFSPGEDVENFGMK